ncbi:Phosphatase YbjI [Leclercia adecarboxylata]|uniref:Phosphatase YbjI n=1 Tax=Leclercia adecarboxylata TaxID=83655 RepID=A0A4U9HQF6_9ENTR|nr:Phosphatase YbjI [Leclercia adecarboxylata]
MNAGEDVYNGELTQAQFATVAEFLCTIPEVEVIACGKGSAYTLKHYGEAFPRSCGEVLPPAGKGR